MRHTIHQHRITASAISLGFMTVVLSLVQPVPYASAQLLTKPISQETSGTGTQGKRHGNIASGHRYPTNPIEKMDAQTSTRKPHRLIRKPQSLPLASVESSLSDSPSVSSVPSSPQSLQREGTTSQPEEPSVPRRSIGAAVPLATISATPSAAAPTGFTTTGTAPTGAIPLAAAGAGNSSSSGNGSTGGRTMRRLSAEISGLTQLVSPPTGPTLSSNPVTGGPAIGMNPINLSFTAQQGGSNPAPQILTINNTGHGTLNWTASESAAWLSLSPTSGTGTGVVTAIVAAGALAPGSYSETITLSASGATPVTIPVSFTVSAAPVPPAIGASPTTLSFAATQGGGNPAAQTLNISNTGGGTLTWSASESTPWLGLSATSGTGNGSMAVSVVTGSLAVGAHSGTITLNGGASPVTIPVAFTVTAAPVPPAIGASPTTLSFAATQGGGNPAAQTLNISNTGGGTLTWSASESTPWLGLSATSGTGNGSMAVSVVTGSLAVGAHSGTITLNGGASPVTIPVSFTVSAAPVPPAIGASPTTLSFAATQGGGNPAAQTLNISNTGGGTLTWSASESTPWLGLSSTSGTGNGSMAVSVVTGSLAVGAHSGTITLNGGASPVTIPVSFTVAAAPVPPAIGVSPTTLSFAATQGGANPAESNPQHQQYRRWHLDLERQ